MERSQGMWMDKIDAFCDWREAAEEHLVWR